MTEAPSFLDPVNAVPGVRATWIGRTRDVPVNVERDEALRRLRPHHQRAVAEFSPSHRRWWRAEQVHGNRVALVPGAAEVIAADGLPQVPEVDGLITDEPGAVLSIYVADCGAIWLADCRTGAIGLLHSGKKGTESGIFSQALAAMHATFDTRPADVVAVLGPCIRPPDYEVDFAATIAAQAAASGIGHFSDCGANTATNLDRYYSYRMEHGQTGRMMALITRDLP